MARIYFESVKKWAIQNKLPISMTSFSLIFVYLMALGLITDVTYSGDMKCTATEWSDVDNLCYAYMNFTAKEDVFIYPLGYDPWGRNTPFEFSPSVKDWKLQRIWGSGWRDIPLDTGCTGTWCGGKKFNTVDNPAGYSYAFRAGKEYQIRIVAIKSHSAQTIKWWSDDLSVPDPEWAGEIYELKSPCILNKTVQHLNYTECWNVTYDINVTCYPTNETCDNCITNSTGEYCWKEEQRQYQQCQNHYYYTKECAEWDSRQFLKYGDVYILTKEQLGIYCSQLTPSDDIVCDQCGNDGNCDGIIQPGESWAEFKKNKQPKEYGHNENTLKKSIKEYIK